LRVTLFLFDIDNFKHYNDTYGHAVGDMVLRQAAVMMRRCCRAHDIIGRIGGDEFAVVFWDLPGSQGRQDKLEKARAERRRADVEHPQEAFFISERFRKEISSAEFSFLGHEGKGVLTISGGLASFSHDGMTPEELLEQADGAMLEAKRSGKNRIYLVGKPK
jgi:PleD family two-component response regulator